MQIAEADMLVGGPGGVRRKAGDAKASLAMPLSALRAEFARLQELLALSLPFHVLLLPFCVMPLSFQRSSCMLDRLPLT